LTDLSHYSQKSQSPVPTSIRSTRATELGDTLGTTREGTWARVGGGQKGTRTYGITDRKYASLFPGGGLNTLDIFSVYSCFYISFSYTIIVFQFISSTPLSLLLFH
jgi:hypothetical protein